MTVNTENIEAVLFDMDGTLLDSMWLWKTIDIEYLKRHNVEYPEGLQEGIAGKSFHETAIYFKERFGIKDDIEKMKNDWNDMAYDLYKHRVKPKKGADVLVKKLREKGIKTGICTSNSIELTEVALKANNMENDFDVILTGSEIMKGKPDPYIYLESARRLGVNSKACLVFEDIVSGILSGQNAGMKVIAVNDDFSKEETDRKMKLTGMVIDDFTGICEYF